MFSFVGSKPMNRQYSASLPCGEFPRNRLCDKFCKCSAAGKSFPEARRKSVPCPENGLRNGRIPRKAILPGILPAGREGCCPSSGRPLPPKQRKRTEERRRMIRVITFYCPVFRKSCIFRDCRNGRRHCRSRWPRSTGPP